MKRVLAFVIGVVLGGCAATSPSQTGEIVKITGLGSHDGELCPFDRALIFEDPDGTRFSTTSAARCAAAVIRGSARSTRYSSLMYTATISATRTNRLLMPEAALSPICR